jgi:formiminotetrahydrofolate cyclodeaminase
MKLIDMKMDDYLELLKSDAPAPGGGSVSALSGAQGCALFMMVADLTIGKSKYEDYQEICLAAKEKGQPLYEELMAGIDKDTDAFNLISNAFKMPKDTDEEKAARKKAIADGTLAATEIPFRNMQLAYEGLQIAKTLVGHSNPNCASDLGVGILQLRACVYGAWLNVKINLPGVKDIDKAKYFQEEGQKMFSSAGDIARKCFNEVNMSL